MRLPVAHLLVDPAHRLALLPERVAQRGDGQRLGAHRLRVRCRRAGPGRTGSPRDRPARDPSARRRESPRHGGRVAEEALELRLAHRAR